MSVGMWKWTGSCVVCVCVCGWIKMESFVHILVVWPHIFPCANTCLFPLCPLECHWYATDDVPLHVADNEHINMYIPSQVNACLALQFHGPVSGLGSFHSTNNPWFLSIRWRKKNIVLNYWTYTWLTGWLMKLKGKETEKEERAKIAIVKLIDAKDNFRWGVDTKKYAKYATRVAVEGTKLMKLLFGVMYPFFQSPKSYSRQSIRNEVVSS